MAKYKLVKTFIQEGKTSSVDTGQSSTGSEIKVIRTIKPEDIQIGDEVYVGSGFTNYIKTSPVQRVEVCTDDSYTIWTETSVYKLDPEEDK